MYTIIYLTIIASLILPLQSQRIPGYPNFPVTPPYYLRPTFSDLGTTQTTPYPYNYPHGNYYNQKYNKIRIWPYVIDQYPGYPYYNNKYNYFAEGLRPTLQTYNTPSGAYPWQNHYHNGKK